MRTATRSTRYESQSPTNRSPACVERSEMPWGAPASTSQCKRRSHTTRLTQRDESAEIRFSDSPDKKSLPLQTLRKNEAPAQGQLSSIRRPTTSGRAIQRLFPAIPAARLLHVATRL